MASTPPSRRLPHVSPGTLMGLRRLMALLQRLSPSLAARLGFSLFLRPSRRRLDAADAPQLARARHSSLQCEGSAVQVYQWGDGPRHVVLVHGWGSHAPRFAPLVEALLAGGWRVTAFDAPAHGQSAGRRSSLPQFQQALLAVLALHGPADLVIGHSLGALAVAMCLGDGLITPSPHGAVLVSMPTSAGFLLRRYEEMFSIGPETSKRFVKLFTQRFGHRPDHFAVQRVASGLALPLLLIHDEGDDVVPVAQSVELAATLPGARLHLTQGLGHSGLLRDAATIDVIIGFAQEIATP